MSQSASPTCRTFHAGNSAFRLALVYGAVLASAPLALAAPIHHWTFEEPDGTPAPQVQDSVGTRHGTFVNMDDTNRSTDVPAIASTRSLSFNGADEQVTFTRLTLLDTMDFSLSLWYRGTESRTGAGAANIGRTVVGTGDANAVFATLSLDQGYVSYRHYDGGWQSNITSSTPVNDDQWHHIALVNHANRTADLYIDGVAEVVGQSSIAFFNATFQGYAIDAFMFGYSNIYTSGKLDEVALYNHALTAAEVSALAAVPEPATAALLGLGLVFGMARRSRG